MRCCNRGQQIPRFARNINLFDRAQWRGRFVGERFGVAGTS
jgi:hypothetical protein